MDETVRHKGNFHGDQRSKQDGDSGGTGRCLKHQWRKETLAQWDLPWAVTPLPCAEVVTNGFLVHENIEKYHCFMVSLVQPFRGPRSCP